MNAFIHTKQLHIIFLNSIAREPHDLKMMISVICAWSFMVELHGFSVRIAYAQMPLLNGRPMSRYLEGLEVYLSRNTAVSFFPFYLLPDV